MTELLLYLYAESPVHAGGSDTDGVIDLPIQREASTGYPVIWGQSLKGALRQAWRDRQLTDETLVFGSAEDSATPAGAGRLSVGDAQLVAMPAPTLRRTFAWVTSALALSRLTRKYARLGHKVPPVPQPAADSCLAIDAPWCSKAAEAIGVAVTSIEAKSPGSTDLKDWAARLSDDCVGSSTGMATMSTKLREDLITAGDDLAGLLFTRGTEISVRVQLKPDEKTVAKGPFIAEYLPTDTILAASLSLRDGTPQHLKDLQAMLGTASSPRLIQIGGNETIGKGLVWTALVESGTPA